MSRSINNHDTNWKREWEDEQTLTLAEQREEDCLRREEEALNAQIMDDLRMIELEIAEEEEEREYRRAEQRWLESENLVESLYRDYEDHDDPVC